MSSYIGDVVKNGLMFAFDAANAKSYISGSAIWNNLSGTNITASLFNTPVFSSTNGGTLVFDGSNQYAQVTRPSGITTGGSLTISMYARWTSVGTTTSTIQTLIDNNHSAPNIGFFIQDRPDLNKVLTFSVRPSTTTQVSSSFIVGNGNWYHITGTHDGTTSRLYINGVLDGIATEAGGIATVQPNITFARWQGGGGSRYMNGRIGQVLLYNRALSANEVLENYNANKGRYDTTRLSPAIKPRLSTNGLVLHLDAANYRSYVSGSTVWRDLSGNGNNADLNNGPVFNSGNGGHLVFDGVNDYARITNSSTLNMGGKSFTADIWISVSTSSGSERIIFEYNVWSTQGTYQVTTQNGNQIVVNFIDAQAGGKALYYTYTPFTTGVWTNVVGQFDTVNNTTSIYINGSRVAQNTAVTQEIGNAVSSLHICSRGGGSLFMPCKLASLKMYDRALSADEIKENYNLLKTRFNIP